MNDTDSDCIIHQRRGWCIDTLCVISVVNFYRKYWQRTLGSNNGTEPVVEGDESQGSLEHSHSYAWFNPQNMQLNI